MRPHTRHAIRLCLLSLLSMRCLSIEVPPTLIAAQPGDAVTTNTVLFLGSTLATKSTNGSLCGPACTDATGSVNGATWEAYEAFAGGYDVEIANDTIWNGKTSAQFMTYKAIAFGDSGAKSTSDPGYKTASGSIARWGPAIKGSIIILGTDPANHAGTSIVTIPASGAPYGPQVVMRRGIAFAAAGDKTGAYICLGHYFGSAVAPAKVDLLNYFGNFTMVSSEGDDVIIGSATSQMIPEFTVDRLSKWNSSIHEVFHTYPGGPEGFQALASDNADGSYILAYIPPSSPPPPSPPPPSPPPPSPPPPSPPPPSPPPPSPPPPSPPPPSPPPPSPPSPPPPSPPPPIPSPVCKNSSFKQFYKGKLQCKMCVSTTSPSAFDASKKCYRSVSIKGGTACGTAVLIAESALNHNGQCVNAASTSHNIKLKIGPSSDGVNLESIIISSLRLSGPRGLGHSLSASHLQGGSMTVVQFKDPYRSLTPRSHVTLTGYSKAKGSSLYICFTALVQVC